MEPVRSDSHTDSRNVLARKKAPARIDTFNLRPGRKIGGRYEVIRQIGKGTEGEVYQILETDTKIYRAAKIYYPHRDPDNRSTIWHARKLNTLRHCPIVLQYHHTEVIRVRGDKVRCLISDLCEGDQIERWVMRHPQRRLDPLRAMLVLYHLARGIEAIHALGEYHADVHTQNILIQPVGVGFELTLVDFYNWGKPARYKQQQDIYDTVRVLYECVGGRRHYAASPPEVRHICAGMQRKLILKRFPTMSKLRRHLETFKWETML
ncbi:MAG: protein kinase [Phycisphaera sp.]|nr:protein kinase [Phycisphaera sp.]